MVLELERKRQSAIGMTVKASLTASETTRLASQNTLEPKNSTNFSVSGNNKPSKVDKVSLYAW
ncbi:MAG: hypothetical protein ACYTXA_25445 [Nostoc sp.]